ncbi:MAG TPA: phytanoyl-CoA dioxygenase family protein [Burkholderiaceae bacterium]|nr:phytanoyl-CoA dioxygenase family protein [Burkholderiaceae bacterium]
MLSADQKRRYREDGYLLLPGFRPPAELAALRARALEIVETFDPASMAAHGSGVFTTRGQSADAWFLGSADRVRCFFEEEAFDSAGALRQPKALSINKIGHALHELDPVFRAFSHGPRWAGLAADLGLAQPQLWQSMFIFKQPGIGGEVRWHQDATFLHSEPISVTGFWIALEDARVDNGCLWAAPGGHRGPLRQRYVRDGDGVHTMTLDDTPWPSLASAVPLEVAAGTLVCLHGLLPHYSAPNRSPQSRHAYSLHAIDGRSRWSSDNWLRRSDTPRGFESAPD